MDIKRYIVSRYTKYLIGQIPLYHTCYYELPSQINCHIHNVKPEVFFKQLSWLKENFDIVTLEEWFKKKYKGGSVTITFDDAYKSFFDNALPILEELKIPVTMFVVGATLEGEIFWRDKIRFVVCTGLTDKFITFLSEKTEEQISVDTENFYKLSKSEDFLSRITSKKLDKLLNEFFREYGFDTKIERYCIERESDLPDHPLITYGNHSYRHYLLSSLSEEELMDDLSRNHSIIKKLEPRKTTTIFSVPFGRQSSINKPAVDICTKLGVKGLLLSDNRLNNCFKLDELYGMPVGYRFLAPGTLQAMKGKIHSMSYSKMKRTIPGK